MGKERVLQAGTARVLLTVPHSPISGAVAGTLRCLGEGRHSRPLGLYDQGREFVSVLRVVKDPLGGGTVRSLMS